MLSCATTETHVAVLVAQVLSRTTTETHVAVLVAQVLSCATTETDNPDLRDRAYIYWRLLSTDPEVWWHSLHSAPLALKAHRCLLYSIWPDALIKQSSNEQSAASPRNAILQRL